MAYNEIDMLSRWWVLKRANPNERFVLLTDSSGNPIEYTSPSDALTQNTQYSIPNLFVVRAHKITETRVLSVTP